MTRPAQLLNALSLFALLVTAPVQAQVITPELQVIRDNYSAVNA